MKTFDEDRISYFWDKIKRLVNKKTEKMVISSDTSVKDWVTITQEEFDNLRDNNQLIEGTIYNVIDGGNPAHTSIPIGTGLLWYGELETLPEGLLPQDGRELNKNEYSSLFKVLGYKYGGSGDMFKLPDIRGRVIVHPDGSTEFESLGQKGGEKIHQLTTNEIPSHYHQQQYNIQGTGTVWGVEPKQGKGGQVSGLFTSYTGGSQAHNNIQPYITAYYVIKVKEDAYTEDLRNLDNIVESLQNDLRTTTEQSNDILAKVDELEEEHENFIQKSGDTMTGLLIQRQGHRVWEVASGYGQSGYIKIARLTLTNNYANAPIKLSLIQRSGVCSDIIIGFNNFSSYNSASIATFRIVNYGPGRPILYITKVDDQNYDLYIRKVEAYDNISITDYQNSYYASGNIKITWQSDFTTTEPTSIIKYTAYNPFDS